MVDNGTANQIEHCNDDAVCHGEERKILHSYMLRYELNMPYGKARRDQCTEHIENQHRSA